MRMRGRGIRVKGPAGLFFAGGALAFLGWNLYGPDYLFRSLPAEAIYLFAGAAYHASLACPDAPRHRAYRLRAADSDEANLYLAERFPQCLVEDLRRKRWRRRPGGGYAL